jgi:hypothetical protein
MRGKKNHASNQTDLVCISLLILSGNATFMNHELRVYRRTEKVGNLKNGVSFEQRLLCSGLNIIRTEKSSPCFAHVVVDWGVWKITRWQAPPVHHHSRPSTHQILVQSFVPREMGNFVPFCQFLPIPSLSALARPSIHTSSQPLAASVFN